MKIIIRALIIVFSFAVEGQHPRLKWRYGTPIALVCNDAFCEVAPVMSRRLV
jgi:hypothetical protein